MRLHSKAIIVLAGLASVVPLLGQTATATLSGTVTDASGGVVPGVQIAATNTETNLVRTGATNSAGVFTIPLLPPGNYTVAAKHQGFAPVDMQGVVLQVGERVAVDIVLTVGALAESVTVSADAGQLQVKTESGERSEVITHTQVRDLALNGRNVLDLMKTVPGVVSAVNGQVSSATGLDQFNINGTRGTQKQLVIDGTSNIVSGANNRLHVTINPDSIAEVKVLTSNFQAEYGKAGGGFIQYTTRSGTSQFHGGARYFRRHDSLNANDFFNNVRGFPRQLYRYNYYGYDFAGPVLLPWTKFNRGRNKLFFFFNQEFYEQLIPTGASTVRMPTERERNGDFSQTTDGNGNPVSLRDPLATGACSATNRAACFPGNIIPRSRFFNDGPAILSVYPLPNDAGGGLRYNYSSQLSAGLPRREYVLRVDYNMSGRTRFSARMIHNSEDEVEPYGGGRANVQTNFPISNVRQVNAPWNFAFTLIHTLNPSMTNEFIFGPSRAVTRVRYADQGALKSTYGIKFPMFFPDVPGTDIVPSFQFGGIANQNFPSMTLHPLRADNTNPVENYTDNLMKVAGKHTLKVGLYVQKSTQSTSAGANSHGVISFNSDANNPLNTGHPLANALLGIYTQYNQHSAFTLNTFRYVNAETYVQDTWKATRRLTLDYGLRVSWIPPAYELGRQTSLFVPGRYDPARQVRLYEPVLVGSQRRAVDPVNRPVVPTVANTLPTALIGFIVPGSGDLLNGIAQANKGYLRGGFDARGPQWGPRIGFAVDVTGKGTTVIRGGWGISYDRVQGNVISAQVGNPPFITNPRLFYGYLAELPMATGQYTPTGMVGYWRNSKIPNVHSVSLGVQRNIGFGTLVDAAYVGTFSRHMVQQRNINAVPYFTTFTRAAQDPTRYAGSVVPDLEPGLPAAYRRAGFNFSGANALPVDFLRPYPGFGDVSMREFVGSANYHSLQVSVNRKLSRRFTFGLAYTWSKTMETGNADFEGNNPYDTRRYDYRVANFDRTHTLVINYVYELPKASGPLGGGKIMRAIADHWQVSGISQYYSGTPFELGLNIQGINTGQRILGTYSLSPRPYRHGGAAETSGGLLLNPDGYYAPAIGDIGPYPRTYLRNPGFFNNDLSVFKNFPLFGERRSLQIRLEMFNAFNHTQFDGINSGTQLMTPAGVIGAGVFSDYPNVRMTNNIRPAGSTAFLGQFFGEHNSTRDPRIIQLAVKLYF